MANAEIKVISALTKNKDASTLLTEDVDELFSGYYADVWAGIKSYYSKFRSVPGIEVLQERYKDLDYVETTAPTAYYLEELKNDYVGNRIEQIVLSASKAKDSGESPQQILDKLNASITKLGRLTTNVRDLDISDIDAAAKHYDAVRQRTEEMGGSPGISTGFKAIDVAYPTGMAPGHLIVVIGWPSRNKTWLTGYIACNAQNQGRKVMIVSLEMSPETMRDRLYTMMGSGLFSNRSLSVGDINTDDLREFGKKRFAEKPGIVVVSNEGQSSVTPNVVQAKIDQHKPDLVILDYHQLFMNNGKSNNPTERGMAVSREFKLLAVTNNIPIIDNTAATQSDVSDRDSPPMMSQVAWSKAIEYDADLAFAVHGEPDSGLTDVVGRKNRHGPLFDFVVEADIDRGVWKEKYTL